MTHDTALIATIAIGFGVALFLGLLAARVGLPPIVGYLVAGIIVGPYTPGFIANADVASQAAEMGVVLLMFGVGLHFSLRDLMTVRATVVPGALLQIAITSSIALTIGRFWGLSWGGALVLGLSLAVASTVVMLKGLEARDRLDSPDGRVAVGWLVVEDIAMIVVLVLLPALSPMLGGTVPSAAESATGVGLSLLMAIGKVIAFGALMFGVGRRIVPWLLEHVARLGSRELFTLTVLSIALGVGALASQVFGVSFALGAFFAGAVVSESEVSQRAAADALPLQHAFAVLFFLSVGMLFDPRVLLEHPGQVLTVFTVIVAGKLTVSYSILRFLGQSARTAITVGGGIAQIGEFSFILTALGVSLGLLSRGTQELVVAGALLSITVNQPLSAWLQRRLLASERELSPEVTESQSSARISRAIFVGQAGEGRRITDIPGAVDPFDFSELTGHVILVGYGRVGTTVTEALDRASVPHVVVEEQERIVAGVRRRGERAVSGDATRPDVLHRAGISGARLIVVTAPEPIRARRIVEVARELNPGVAVAVRTHSATEQAYFEELLHTPGLTGRAVYAEREVALSLAHFTLLALGRSDDDADFLIEAMRGVSTSPTETFPALHTRELEALHAPERRKSRPPPAG